MKQKQGIRRYAKLLLNTTGIDAMPQVLSELQSVSELLSISSDFRGLLENPLFTNQEREKVIRELSKRMKLSDNTIRFIIHLSDLRIIANIQDLIKTATDLYLEKKKRVRAVVTTPVSVDVSYENRLKTSLAKITGRDVDIEYIVDPALLGGMLIKVGSAMYDSSIKGQLRLLKADLIKNV